MKALIIGGGIAGTAAALALHQVGIDAAVYEAHPTGAEGLGAFLTVMPGGIDALRRLGAEQASRQHGVTAGGVELLNADGESTSRSEFGGDGPPPFTLTRSDLAAGLRAEAARRHIPIACGKRLTDLRTTATGVTACFADGTHASGTILIGADGVWSATRTLLNPDAPPPRPVGRTVVFGFGAHLADPPPTGSVRFCLGHEAFFGYKTGPDGTGWWFARLATTEPNREPGTTPAAWKHRVLSAVTGDHTPAAAVVRVTGDQVIGIDAYDLTTATHASTPIWHSPTTVLLGDAAHAADPATGQGASQALEDALALAHCLHNYPEPRHAFPAYEHLRRTLAETEARKSATLLS